MLAADHDAGPQLGESRQERGDGRRVGNALGGDRLAGPDLDAEIVQLQDAEDILIRRIVAEEEHGRRGQVGADLPQRSALVALTHRELAHALPLAELEAGLEAEAVGGVEDLVGALRIAYPPSVYGDAEGLLLDVDL